MKVDLIFTLEDLKNIEIHNKVVIALDVLRATTTMITAFCNGASSIISVPEIEKAVELKKSDSRTLLCGERNGQKISGFDKGNSPQEYNDVQDMHLVFCSTNGSKTIENSKDSKKTYLGAFINAAAVVDKLLSDHPEDEILIACSGKLGRVCNEDTICAGYIIDLIRNLKDNTELDDASRIAWDFYRYNSNNIMEIMKNSEHGQHLISIGAEKDVELCSIKDIMNITPYFDKEDYKIKN
ncbi:MAG: 2-phosphosulfolactate phosphatase [Candidatus Delongbacteria bacterium]|nr:2-phosphosulfolactate phosphatase [Candidatus Delongbacteria bacterium]MBN2836956.1 2-phosphosulfolactate phosphatase [Candidatus Delongbacteria bacterium]